MTTGKMNRRAMMNRHICPKCGCRRVKAVVTHRQEFFEENGDIIAMPIDYAGGPSQDSDWRCTRCGEKAVVDLGAAQNQEQYRDTTCTTEHICKKCGHSWLEWSDNDQYPNYCPLCGYEIR